ncbi:uncharacterized protein BX664DRAFT_338789 [Halteromyces radiatus]|uniref:uncharacterized protein n=1 Tax=Halteromyces radiatus TaxID=101107 RepID=UPI002220E2AE|nr:uncharacterized protein BX664DRAFT_338789 [Halteromyces radiatus]KAI8085197.1 hypothetical protein BX664DRAFT_338789 [Halteromyces radiatus]
MISPMEKSLESPSTTTSPSGWKIKIRPQSDTTSSHIPATPPMESDGAFNQKLDLWAQTTTFQNMATHICHDVQKDMNRRRQNRPSPNNTPIKPINDNSTTRQYSLSDLDSFIFEKSSILGEKEYQAWVQSSKDTHHPHQWLKLASLFHIHPKTAHQRSLLFPATLEAARMDRQVSTEVNRKQLENYLDIRRSQNRTYAENAVAEGVKLYEDKMIKEALDYYKRGLDMDPQYAEGWYRVAESLLQQKRTDDAITQLKRAIRIDPTHENAKSLLCTLENTTKYTNDKKRSSKEILAKSTTAKESHSSTDRKHSRKEEEEHSSRHNKDDSERRHRPTKRRRRSSSPVERKRVRKVISPSRENADHNDLTPSSSSSPTPKSPRITDDHASKTTKERHGSRHRHRDDRHSYRHSDSSSRSDRHRHSHHKSSSSSARHKDDKNESSSHRSRKHHRSSSRDRSSRDRSSRHRHERHHKERSSRKTNDKRDDEDIRSKSHRTTSRKTDAH